MAVCIAVIAKENYPLSIICSPNVSDSLEYHYIVHTSLDVIEEKISNMSKTNSINTPDNRDFYLAQLYPAEDYHVFGYVTNTKVKFVLVVEASNTHLRDNDIRSTFRRLHNAYTDVVCNPFYNPGEPITSAAFNEIVSSMIVEQKNQSLFSI